jgi:AraC family L-rhamnose operon regulatory protein RhaS
MTTPVAPIYRGRKSRFEIDSCAPQSAAVRSGKIQMHALTKGHYPGVLLQPAQLPGITSIGFWNGADTQDWGLEAHRNEGIEITFLENGAMAFSVEAKKFELRSGHFTLTRPWQLHKLGAPNIGPGKLHWLILDVGVRRPNQDWRWPRWVTLTPADKDELTRKLRHNENAVWNSSPEIAAAFRGLSAGVLHWKQPHVESRMITLLNQLLLGILTALTEQQTHQNPGLTSRRHTVELFLRDLTANSASSSEPWTSGKMAAHCGMGVTAFSKYCRQLVNNGPVEYLNLCRLDRAARQLKENPALPVTQIAFQNGFNSSQYFTTLFRHRFHQTPREYRARAG